MSFQYDVLIIGSGPGGYSAGVTSARIGAKVCIVEKDALGGVCVNKGCIPTKTILNTALMYHKLKNREEYGIRGNNLSVDYPQLLTRVKNVVSNVRKGMEQVINLNKIDVIRGDAGLILEGMVRINDREIRAKKIIIATGSKPKELKDFGFDSNCIFSSEEFLPALGGTELPGSVLIIGAGIIGCEWAGILASLGVSVTLVEVKDKILPEEDSDLTRVIEASLKKMGVDIRLNTTVSKISQERVIVCVGREPVTDGVKQLETKEGGWIKVNEYLQTNLSDVYAIGDVIGPPLLAYTAQREGVVAAYNALGKKMVMDYRFIPRGVFSIPELASVGARESEVPDAGIARGYFRGLGKALADGETDGFVKIIYDKSNYKILGVGIVGKNAGELISEATLALKYGLTVQEWASIIRPHPVLSEIFGVALWH